MKGIVLAGGSGTRLYPTTKGVCKQLLPIYDKPMIYYPISSLMLSGTKEIAIVHNPGDKSKFMEFLGNGDDFGVKFTYIVQENPNGIAQALIIAKDFIGGDNVCLILGDNFFYGQNFSNTLKNAAKLKGGGFAFCLSC